MTTKQMYSELAKIAGFMCETGKKFARSEQVTPEELKRAQGGLLALLDKLNQNRTERDFGVAIGGLRSVQLERLYQNHIMSSWFATNTLERVPQFYASSTPLPDVPTPGNVVSFPLYVDEDLTSEH